MIIIELVKNLSTRLSRKIFAERSQQKSFEARSASEQSSVEALSRVEASRLLFLQEIDRYHQEQQALKISGKKMLQCLSEIRLSLLTGQLTKDHLLTLQNHLVKNQTKFKFPELQQVIDDIVLRAEVELTKIAINSN